MKKIIILITIVLIAFKLNCLCQDKKVEKAETDIITCVVLDYLKKTGIIEGKKRNTFIWECIYGQSHYSFSAGACKLTELNDSLQSILDNKVETSIPREDDCNKIDFKIPYLMTNQSDWFLNLRKREELVEIIKLTFPFYLSNEHLVMAVAITDKNLHGIVFLLHLQKIDANYCVRSIIDVGAS